MKPANVPCHVGVRQQCAKNSIGRPTAHVRPRRIANSFRTFVSPASQYVLLDRSSGPSVVEGCDTLVLDCDGVLWQGSRLVPNAVQAVRSFRRQGKRLLFVTNNSSKSRLQYVSKFESLGLEVSADEIVSSSYAAAAYLRAIGFQKKAFLIGQQGLQEELCQHGIDFIGGNNFELPLFTDADSMKALQVDPDIGAVVVGWDPAFSYSRLVYASVCLRELPGCLLVVSNMDNADRLSGGRMMPGTGCIAAAIQLASAATLVVVGKGGSWLLPFLCQEYNLEPSRAAIIGDRLDTDIAMGKEGDVLRNWRHGVPYHRETTALQGGGMVTMLPLTGVTTLEDVRHALPTEVPDFVMPSIATLAGLPSI